MTRPHPLALPIPLFAPLCAMVWGLFSACGSTMPQTTFEDPATLLAEREEWRGSKEGSAVLRYHVEGLVDARPDPSRATSRLVIHLVLARFSGEMPTLSVPLPQGAERIHTSVRLTGPTTPPTASHKLPDSMTSSDIDPGLVATRLTLPAPPEGGIVEAILEYEIAGTLASDARWLGFEGVPTGEVLLRYSLPTHSRGRFTTTLPNARPLTTEKDDRTLIALFAQDLPPLPPFPQPAGDTRPLARYATIKVAPLGYEADLASTWRAAAADYYRGLVDRSVSLTDGYEVPHRPTDAINALTWTQARAGLEGPAAEVAWNAPKMLPAAIAKNNLSAVDKVHLMAWLLREAKIPFVFAMARPAVLPPLDAGFPTPGAFSIPLLFLPTLSKIADPGCRTCAPGEVRESLRGGQALLLTPAGLEPTLVPLVTP